MYVPENHRMCELESEFGEMHMIYEWKGDAKLTSRWPDKRHCEAKGWAPRNPNEQKTIVAAYHWKAITGGGTKVEFAVSDSWTSPAPEIETQVRYTKPIVVFRVHLVKQFSQYLGWLLPEKFQAIQPVNVSGRWTTHQKLRRVVLDHYLTKGPLNAEQKELFAEGE